MAQRTVQAAGRDAGDLTIEHQIRSVESSEHPSLQNERAVIVEDEGIIQMQLRKSLQRLGIKVVGTALSGDTGIEVCLRERPDIIVMDVNMPGKLNGLQAAQQILSAYRACIIMITAYTEFEDEAARIGACGYMVKPVDDRTLQRHLRDAYAAYQTGQTG